MGTVAIGKDHAVSRFLIAVLLLVGVGWAPQTSAQPKQIERADKSIRLVSVAAEPGVNHGIMLVSPLRGLKKLRKAINLIYQNSPYSVAAIETLKKNGNVIIVYSPRRSRHLTPVKGSNG